MVKLVCQRAFERLQAKHSGVRFDCYIDDITITAEGSEALVLELLVAALKDLAKVVEQELH